jgi:hypothetical protein
MAKLAFFKLGGSYLGGLITLGQKIKMRVLSKPHIDMTVTTKPYIDMTVTTKPYIDMNVVTKETA